VANQPHQFKNRDITRCLKAAIAGGVEHPAVHIKLPNGTEYMVGSFGDKSAAPAAVIPKSGKTRQSASRGKA
jgi:hypothetical protein